MPLELTPEQARKLGIKVEGKVKRRKDRSVASGPYRWRCQCGVEGDSHASADKHVAPGHNNFLTITEETA